MTEKCSSTCSKSSEGLECTTITPVLVASSGTFPSALLTASLRKVKLFEKRIEEYEMMLDESTIWLVRLQGVGYAKAEDMVNAGVSGPNIRAAGVNYDVRWAHPYSVYDQVDWEPAVEKPTSVKGADCYDRYRVRMEEMRQSCRMILDAIEKIPGGKNTNYASGDAMILAKAPTRAPEGATGFSNYECTRGASQFYIKGGGDGRGKNPYRLSIRSPMFYHNSLRCKNDDWLQSGRHSCHHGQF